MKEHSSFGSTTVPELLVNPAPEAVPWVTRAIGARAAIVLSRTSILWNWYRRVVENWFEVFPLLTVPNSHVRFRFTDGDQLQCSSAADWPLFQKVARLKLLNSFADARVVGLKQPNGERWLPSRPGLEFSFRGDRVVFRFDESPLEISYGLAELFLLGEYADFEVAGKTVLDIGANIGDSIVYFAKRGAQRVIGYEGSPPVYRRCLENVALNGLTDRAAVRMAVCGSIGGRIAVRDADMTEGTWVPRRGESGVEVAAVTLEDIVEEWGLRQAVLKIDCEGCEYGLLNRSEMVLGAFDSIVIEYHYSPGNLVSILRRAGFTIRKCTFPMHAGRGPLGQDMFVGTILASRRNGPT